LFIYNWDQKGFFPETKNDFFDEKLSEDLKLPDNKNISLNTDDHYQPIGINDKFR